MLQTNRQKNIQTREPKTLPEVANPCDYKVYHVNLCVGFRRQSHIKFKCATINIRPLF